MVDPGAGAGTGGGAESPFFRSPPTKREREAFREYHHRNYGVSFKSAVTVIVVFVAVLVGVYLLFT